MLNLAESFSPTSISSAHIVWIVAQTREQISIKTFLFPLSQQVSSPQS